MYSRHYILSYLQQLQQFCAFDLELRYSAVTVYTYGICKRIMVVLLLFALLLHLLNGTHEQVGNATLLEGSNQDSLMSAPKSVSYHPCETNQSNATREHLKVLTSYKIGTRTEN